MDTKIICKIFNKPQHYDKMLDLQEKTREDVIAGKNNGTVFFLEHFPVYTSGLRGTESQFLNHLSNVPVYKIKRGGELTWHGAGQLVIYPVIDFRKAGFCSIREFVNFFGNAIEKVLAGYCGIKNSKWDEKKAGIWIEDKKIAFSGLHFRKFVPTHGYSLNISADLKYFSNIVPCGIVNCKITSVEMETGRTYSINEISNAIINIIKEAVTSVIVLTEEK